MTDEEVFSFGFILICSRYFQGLLFSMMEFPPSCNVTALEESCNATNVIECWSMYCWQKWTFSLDDAFLLLDDVQVSLQKNAFTNVLLDIERFKQIDGEERHRIIPSSSTSDYGFGVYATFRFESHFF